MALFDTLKRHVRLLRRIIIGAVGFTVLLIGILMIVLPGPALLIVPLGLAILATEFLWARRILDYVKRKAKPTKQAPTD